MGVAVFAVLPELTERHQWPVAVALLAAGVGILWIFARFYPICPSCSHTHEHERCVSELHGFALPLVVAASVHALLDGVGIAASQREALPGLGAVVVAGVVLHKIPEGIALGIMLRASVRSAPAAFGWCVLAESATLAGGLLESYATQRLGTGWLDNALALAGGSFLYLGFHAVHGEWRRRGRPAFIPALTGVAGAAALQHGLQLFWR